MSEDSKVILVALIILTLIVAGIQWLFLRFIHWSAAIVVTGFISFVISFLYVGLKHATPNGSNHSINSLEYISPTFLMFSIFLCGFCLVCYLSKVHTPKIVYGVSLSIIALMVIGGLLAVYITNHYNAIRYHNENYSSCQIEIKTDADVTPIIRRISFKNDTKFKNLTTSIELDENKIIKATNNQSDIKDIPRFTNTIEFQCISTKTGNLFSQEFPFDYSLCQEKKKGKHNQKVLLPIKIVLKTDQKVDLYINNHFIKQYLLNNKE